MCFTDDLNDLKTIFFAVEVGARGYVAESTRSCLSKLGLKSALVKRICKQVSDMALRWSFWVWVGKDQERFFAGTTDKAALTLNELDLGVGEGGDCESVMGVPSVDFQGVLRKQAAERTIM